MEEREAVEGHVTGSLLGWTGCHRFNPLAVIDVLQLLQQDLGKGCVPFLGSLQSMQLIKATVHQVHKDPSVSEAYCDFVQT
jgi:hypothetical protein